MVWQAAPVEILIDDIQAELADRPYESMEAAGGWMFRTKMQFADAIKAAADLGDRALVFTEIGMGVLCAIAYHQPIDTRDMSVLSVFEFDGIGRYFGPAGLIPSLEGDPSRRERTL